MKVFVFTFSVFLTTYLCEARNCNELGILLYEELQCTPNYGQSQPCPLYYTDCEYKRTKGKCRFQGKDYAIGKELLENNTGYQVACFCDARLASKDSPSFRCALLECPEFFSGPPTMGCYRKYQLDKRCSVGEVCPPFPPLDVCLVDGELHRKGQRYIPEGTCKECICDPKRVEDYNGPNCQTIACAFELFNGEDLENHCAPVYHYDEKDGSRLCCPVAFVCQDGSENIKCQKKQKKPPLDVPCKYGSLTLQLGDYFTKQLSHHGRISKLKCTCSLPPLVTCTAKY